MRPPTGSPRLVPATIKMDQELKSMIERLAERERRSPSSCGNVLLQFGVLAWIEQGNLQKIIDIVDEGWVKTLKLRKALAG